jgi:hypothetical protein
VNVINYFDEGGEMQGMAVGWVPYLSDSRSHLFGLTRTIYCLTHILFLFIVSVGPFNVPDYFVYLLLMSNSSWLINIRRAETDPARAVRREHS